jgi:hypothetical protein
MRRSESRPPIGGGSQDRDPRCGAVPLPLLRRTFQVRGVLQPLCVPQESTVTTSVALGEPLCPLRWADEISGVLHEVQVPAAGWHNGHVLSPEMR